MMWPAIMTALLTPYDDHGEVDADKAAALALHLWGQGCGGFVVAGSTGEAYGLSITERERLFRAVRSVLPDDVLVLVGTGHQDTRQAVRLTEAAHSWGADGMLVVAPYYNKPPQRGLVAHFVEVARHTDRPIMVYDVPGRTGVHVAPETVVEAHLQAANIVAVKEAAGTITALITMHRALSDDITLYSGDDALLLPGLAVGAVGVVSVASHVATRPMVDLVNAFHSGRRGEALALHEALWPLSQALFSDTSPIPLKWLMNRLGWAVGGVRPPLTMPPETDDLSALWQAFEQLGLEQVMRRRLA